MLLLDGQPLLRNAGRQAASCIVSHLCRNAVIRAQAEKFLSESEPQDPYTKTIHVLQGEYALVNTHQECQKICLSSSDATTCCILALNCDITGLCGIAHLDHGHAQHRDCLSPLLDGLIAPELYMIGGMCEDTCCGTATAQGLLSNLEDSDAEISIQLTCIGDINTAHDGAPRCHTLAVTRSADPGCIPTNVTASGSVPSAEQRLARVFGLGARASGLESIYDTSKQLLQISNINCHSSRQHLNCYAALLQYPDAYLLHRMSTSPQHEGAHFVPGMVYCVCACSVRAALPYSCTCHISCMALLMLSNSPAALCLAMSIPLYQASVLLAELRAALSWLLRHHEAANGITTDLCKYTQYRWNREWVALSMPE